MPRMDGIEMAEKIRELYPDCVILFLSGYSDKEYLRSAISLQAGIAGTGGIRSKGSG